ncbi:hypothetical protein T492DRAFT_49846 [Pavlovales sp. CCMP2436]|nr:hypothetical protein T492DRAFT_49846 [Pavlovales sp. CCMP2436]
MCLQLFMCLQFSTPLGRGGVRWVGHAAACPPDQAAGGGGGNDSTCHFFYIFLLVWLKLLTLRLLFFRDHL